MAPIPTLVIHGGAGALSQRVSVDVDGLKSGIQQAARLGYSHLVGQTSSAINAVEAAVCSLEDNLLFNAGRGSELTLGGTVEMDAIIMEGRDLRAGGVTCVRNIQNPVSLARLVMEKEKVALAATNELTAVHGTQYEAIQAGKEHPAAGASTDFGYEILGATYSYTVEMRDTGHYGFELPENQIEPCAEEMYAAFIELFSQVLSKV